MLIFDEDERASFPELKESLPKWETVQPYLWIDPEFNETQKSYGFLESQTLNQYDNNAFQQTIVTKTTPFQNQTDQNFQQQNNVVQFNNQITFEQSQQLPKVQHVLITDKGQQPIKAIQEYKRADSPRFDIDDLSEWLIKVFIWN